MTPQHDGSNAFAASPYSLYTSHAAFSSGSRIQVRIVGTYEGFLLQARVTNTTTVVGSWDTPPHGTRHLLCTTLDGAVTHSSKVDKHDQNFTWIAPASSPAGSIQFVATVIKEKLEWQMNVTSSIITTTGYVAPSKAPAKTTTKKTTTEKPGSSADCLAAPVLWLTLGALLTAATAACGV
ncbi:putative defense protein 1 [Petromyzon marinus]|uniref:putative defense protein 1 n=1 Tax=Petromyzon marinus TaxID=7757 RepID=UPI003F6EF278